MLGYLIFNMASWRLLYVKYFSPHRQARSKEVCCLIKKISTLRCPLNEISFHFQAWTCCRYILDHNIMLHSISHGNERNIVVSADQSLAYRSRVNVKISLKGLVRSCTHIFFSGWQYDAMWQCKCRVLAKKALSLCVAALLWFLQADRILAMQFVNQYGNICMSEIKSEYVTVEKRIRSVRGNNWFSLSLPFNASSHINLSSTSITFIFASLNSHESAKFICILTTFLYFPRSITHNTHTQKKYKWKI